MSGSYSEQEAQEILRRAAAVQNTGFMSRDELMRAASELGITPEAVLEAEKQYQDSRALEDLRIRYRAKRKSEFFESLKSFAFFAVAGAFVVNLRPTSTWLWIALIVVAMSFANMLKEGMRYFFQSKDANDKGFEEFKAKEARRKSLADRRTNDRVIEEIIGQTSRDNKQDVAKNLRDLTGLPMNEAKSAVEDYYRRNITQNS